MDIDNGEDTEMEQQVDSKIIERIKKLLALANNNDNEHQAAAAMEKAQELLEAYNLDMHVLGSTAKGAQRSDTNKKGGLYSWQRKLWNAVSELNFCHYLSVKGLAKGSTYEHRLIGSHANVIATEVMAEYLQSTVEKLAQKWAKEQGFGSVFVREAIAYREGMTGRLVERLAARRRQQVREAEEAKRDQQARNEASASNALTIVDIISSEADFNNDYLNGWELGTTARNRHESDMRHKANLAKWEAEEAEHQRRMDTDPEYAAAYRAKQKAQAEAWAKLDAQWAKKAKRRSSYVAKGPRPRAQTAEEKRQGLASYWDGYDKGDTVGIDQQVDKSKQGVIK